jgi:putative ABC transport system permease protein
VIRHLAKLAWNRKAKNALISFELLVAFLVLIVVVTIGLAASAYYARPLGYDYHDVLVVEIKDDITGDDEFSAEQQQRTRALLSALRDVDGVLATSGSLGAPMSFASNRSSWNTDASRLVFEFDEVTDSHREVLDIDLVAGRWFSAEDDGHNDRATVINRSLAREVFGDQDPLGRSLNEGIPQDEPVVPLRIVGVVDDFRKGGELSLPAHFAFFRKRLDRAEERPPAVILIEFDPARRVGLERRVEETARAIAPGWGFSVQPLSSMRRDMLRAASVPLWSLGLVGSFLMTMVGLGLAGVFWQSVAQRRAELGLRRATGSTVSGIIMQVLGEVWAMVSLSVLIGLSIALQLPLFGLTARLGTGLFLNGVLLAVSLIYLLATLAALPPAMLAAQVEPAEALRTE